MHGDAAPGWAGVLEDAYRFSGPLDPSELFQLMPARLVYEYVGMGRDAWKTCPTCPCPEHPQWLY